MNWIWRRNRRRLEDKPKALGLQKRGAGGSEAVLWDRKPRWAALGTNRILSMVLDPLSLKCFDASLWWRQVGTWFYCWTDRPETDLALSCKSRCAWVRPWRERRQSRKKRGLRTKPREVPTFDVGSKRVSPWESQSWRESEGSQVKKIEKVNSI